MNASRNAERTELMMKKINVLILLVIALLSTAVVLYGKNVSDKNSGKPQTISVSNGKRTNSIKKEEIFSCFGHDKKYLLKNLGRNYKVVLNADTNANEYRYQSKGVSLVFDEKDCLEYVICGASVSFDGATAGMDFIEIRKKLGNLKCEEFKDEQTGGKNYALVYEIKDYVVYFSSKEKNGKNCTVVVSLKSAEEQDEMIY